MDKILDIFPFKKEILQKHLKFTANLSLVTSSEFIEKMTLILRVWH